MLTGIIISNISNRYLVKVEKQIYECSARGRFKKEEEITPVVGDMVKIEILEEVNKTAVINQILPRTSYIKRPKLANITQIVLVISTKMPKPDLLLLDKQLAFAEYLGIKPSIVINKMDLAIIEEIQYLYTKIGYTVIPTKAKEVEGILQLKEKLKDNVSAFSGNSGVGKSTLINRIFESAITEEGDISKKNKKGKNTTTAICLYEIEENSYIADTPGFSTFDIYEIETKELYRYFKEFQQYVKNCEFVGCTHIKEEECGVIKAWKQGKIADSRYENYVKIYQDLKDKEEHKW